MPLLEVVDLRVNYGRNCAVKSVNLFVEHGEIVTVLGANGAGKTSLLRALQGVTRTASGRVTFKGVDVTRRESSTRVASGMMLVPEGRQIFGGMSVRENLLMGGYQRSQREVRNDLDAIYDRFPNLAARKDMMASVLSGGEQQMLAIGRALVGRPELIMLDEPSLGLSPLFVGRLFDLVGELNREGMGILLVEQNTHMALQVAARGYVLELGSVVLQGDATALAGDASLTEAYLGGRAARDLQHPAEASNEFATQQRRLQ